MNFDAAEKHLAEMSDRMKDCLSEKCGLKFESSWRTKVTVRPLWCPTLTTMPYRQYHIYLPQPRTPMKRTDEIEEFELAEMEFDTAHETGHILHIQANSFFEEGYHKEKQKLSALPEGMRTPAFEMLLSALEIVAEYSAWSFIELREGMETFLARAYNSEKEARLAAVVQRYSLENKEGLYDQVKSAFQIHRAREQYQAICNVLCKGSLKEIVQVPAIGQILRETEQHILQNPEHFSGSDLFNYGKISNKS